MKATSTTAEQGNLIIRFMILLSILTLTYGCGSQKESKGVPTPHQKNEVKATFFISDSTGMTLIDASQIKSYDWSTHTLSLVPGIREDLHDSLIGSLVNGHPFLVNCNGKVIYQGHFTSSLSSLSLESIVINLFPSTQLEEDQIQIQLGYPTKEVFTGEDLRQSEDVKDALQSLGKIQ